MKTVQLSRVCLCRSRGSVPVTPIRNRPFIRHVVGASAFPTVRVKAATVETANLLDPTAPALLTADDILQILPHRYPFLFVDRVTQMVENERIVGLKNVTMNDNFFTGHFPDRPIMPGVLQVEALAQLAGILMLKGMSDSAKTNFFFGGVEKCRFRQPVVPGDTLVMKVDITKMNMRAGVVKAHGEAYVNDKVTCNADLTLVVATTK